MFKFDSLWGRQTTRTAVTSARHALVDDFMRQMEIVKPNLRTHGTREFVGHKDPEMTKVLVQMSTESWAGVGLGPFKVGLYRS